MTKFWLTFLFLCTLFLVQGQPDIQAGETFKVPIRQVHQAFLSEDEFGLHGVSVLRQGLGGEPRLLMIDYDVTSLLPLKTVDITPEKRAGLERNVTQIFSLKKGFVMAVEERTETNAHQLSLIHINAKKEPTQSFTLASLQLDISTEWPYELVVAPDESGFVLVHHPKANPGTNQQLMAYAFDHQMNSLWKDTIDFPDFRGAIEFVNFTTDGKSNLFFSYVPEREAKTKDSKMNVLHVAGYSSASKRVNELELQLNKRTILNVHFTSLSNHCLITGWFSKEDLREINGFFALQVDASMQTQLQTVHDFTPEASMTLFPQSGYESPDARKSRVEILGVELLDSNRLVVIGERQKKVIAESANGGNGSAFTEIYYFQDVALIELDSNLKYVDGYLIEKGQLSPNDKGEFSSIAWYNFSTGLDFFYNDHPKNKRRRRKDKILKTTATAQRARLTAVTLTKNLLLQQDLKHKKWRSKKIRVKNQEQLASGGLYFYIRKGFKAQLLKVVRTPTD